MRLDLEDFFASVPAGRVFGIFRTAGYPEAVAHTLTALCVTVVPQSGVGRTPPPERSALTCRHARLGRRLATPHLPQGAPTSPALASLAAHGLDRRLTALAPTLRADPSRYADDLTFSGDAGLPAGTLARVVAEIARDEGFRVAPRQDGRPAPQRAPGRLRRRRQRAPQRPARRVRPAQGGPPRRARHGPATANRDGVADFRAHLQGRIAWVGQLHPARGARLQARLDAIAW